MKVYKGREINEEKYLKLWPSCDLVFVDERGEITSSILSVGDEGIYLNYRKEGPEIQQVGRAVRIQAIYSLERAPTSWARGAISIRKGKVHIKDHAIPCTELYSLAVAIINGCRGEEVS